MVGNGRIYIIAEAGVNHNGMLDMALRLVDVAAEAGADAIKFQTFNTEKLVTRNAPKAAYQDRNAGEFVSQFEMLKKLELNQDAYQPIVNQCLARGIKFLSTPFDIDSVDLLTRQFPVPVFKVSSGDLTNAQLLLHIAITGRPVIISTGMASLGEVESALMVMAYGFAGAEGDPSTDNFRKVYYSQAGQQALREKVILLHCTSEYPAPFEEVNLRAMDTLRESFGLPVGFSDHTEGISIAIAAAARGARVIEKHITLDKSLPGPDHKASLDQEELKSLVDGIRQVEKALGTGAKIPGQAEAANMVVVRKSLVAAKSISRGDLFTSDNLTVKRPGNGISAQYYWDWVGRPAVRDYKEGEMI